MPEQENIPETFSISNKEKIKILISTLMAGIVGYTYYKNAILAGKLTVNIVALVAVSPIMLMKLFALIHSQPCTTFAEIREEFNKGQSDLSKPLHIITTLTTPVAAALAGTATYKALAWV